MNRAVVWAFCGLVSFRLGNVWNDHGGSRNVKALLGMEQEVSLKNSNSTATSASTASSITTTSAEIQQQHNQEGWHSIDVFIGNSRHLDHKPIMVKKRMKKKDSWYSQAKQDMLVASLFKNKRNGYFVDLASNDARRLSNTYALENKLGWTGLCIEPNPKYWYDLSYRNCQVVAAAVGKDRMEDVLFRFVGGSKGGIVKAGFDNKASEESKSASTPLYTVPLLEVLERYNTPKVIDYLSLDVEGAEEYIMSIFPIETYRFKVMTVERPSRGLQDMLEAHGYQYISRLANFGETLWAHKSFIEEVGVDHFKKVAKYKGK